MKRASPDVPGPRYVALLELLRTSEALWHASREFFGRWNLSPSQFNILNLLRAAPEGCSQVDLSRRLIMHRSNVTGLVDRLERRRLVKRTRSPDDRRVYRVMLTGVGRRLVEKILPDYYRAADTIWGRFPLARTERLMGDLQRLNHNIGEFSWSGKKRAPTRPPAI